MKTRPVPPPIPSPAAAPRVPRRQPVRAARRPARDRVHTSSFPRPLLSAPTPGAVAAEAEPRREEFSAVAVVLAAAALLAASALFCWQLFLRGCVTLLTEDGHLLSLFWALCS